MKEEIEWFKPNSYAIDYQRNYTNDGDYTSVDYTKNLMDSMNTMFKYIYTSTASGISNPAPATPKEEPKPKPTLTKFNNEF